MKNSWIPVMIAKPRSNIEETMIKPNSKVISNTKKEISNKSSNTLKCNSLLHLTHNLNPLHVTVQNP